MVDSGRKAHDPLSFHLQGIKKVYNIVCDITIDSIVLKYFIAKGVGSTDCKYYIDKVIPAFRNNNISWQQR